jgi:[glutamine synthetase] adenylyltransferase / [glutamine synthetase]-adenylyl-L-tyrosine phosphorylase
MQRLFDEVNFRDLARARSSVDRLSGAIPDEIQKRLRYLLASTPDPDEALLCLDRLHEAHPEPFRRLSSNSAGLQYMVAAFSYSRFLSEAVLQAPEWLEELVEAPDFERVLSPEEFEDRLEADLAAAGASSPLPFSLAVFRRRQLLRIVLRDVLGAGTLHEITEEISNLADAILDVSYRRLRGQLEGRYGVPHWVDANGERQVCSFAIVALGKLGGQELNYSSDIDLMFLYSANGETSGAHPISNKEFFQKLAHQYTDLLSSYTPMGICYRVDLRLRPDGRLGEVCLSHDGAIGYYQTRARDWELQMLIKARTAAGDRALGRTLLEAIESRIYSTTLDFSAVESVSATRERIHEQAARRRGGASGFDIKLARGGIRDIEFLVQCLQRLHGGREPWVRHGGTLLALGRLRDKDFLADSEYSRLASAYQFLRTLEHRLQCAEDRQTHTLPSDPAELDALARRMPAAEIGTASSAETLLGQLNAHLEGVQEIYARVIHAQRPIYYMSPAPAVEPAADVEVEEPGTFAEPVSSNLVRYLDRKAPHLAAMISRGDLRRGLGLFEHYLERILNEPDWLDWLDRDPILTAYVFDIFDHSQYFSEQLIRNPELLGELRGMRHSSQPDLPYSELASSSSDTVGMRRFFRREMFRVQAESICLRTPIFDTLGRTSELADATIHAAYRLAVEEVMAARPPAAAGYQPADRLMVIALGRLGMHEFDLASDADLVFVLPDADVPEMAFWTRVAETMINRLTAYTGEGVVFAVDTRLRPDGREGALVQSEESYREYFAKRAEAWEGITYMKSRAVAGDIERGTTFLNGLQKVDWRRYGQSGRSRKQLLQMRLRLEKELSAGNPLKAGRGSYYDIDFALMYLRLRGAGIFFKVLNTPARIDVIEQMGHLERADADFLRDASTFYRAVDHGIRVSTGQAAGDLPRSESQLEVLAGLVSRWTPDYLHDQPLATELAQVQERTREFFDRLFGPAA